MNLDLAGRFARFPEPLRLRLALGSCGKLHLLETAGLGFSLIQADEPHAEDTARACGGMLLSAWGESPISGEVAGILLNSPALAPMLNEEARGLLRQVNRLWNKPENLDYYYRLAGRRQFDKLTRFLETRIDKEPDNLYWHEQALILGLFQGNYQWAVDLLDRGPTADLSPCLTAIRCQAAILAGDTVTALGLARNLGPVFGPGFAKDYEARALQLAGDADQARETMAEALALAPWNTNMALTLAENAPGLPRTAVLPGSLAVLLYSYNKADDLDATLDSVFASDLTTEAGHALVVALDNGSDDHTARVLNDWQARLKGLGIGEDRFLRLDLPVNVGAPAARNWLMREERVREHDFACYLDDDTALPADWLARLGAAVARYPEAAVWGCKVIDHIQPALIQSADYHFLPEDGPANGLTGPNPDPTRVEPNPIRLSNLHIQTLDRGQFDYCRPCASVTGCCHLFRTAELLDMGGFSINLSPSQYDDLEHDLRLNAQGRFAAYQGGLAVRHRKRTGQASLTRIGEGAGAVGNRYKVQLMHPREEIARSREREHARLLADLDDKLGLADEVARDTA